MAWWWHAYIAVYEDLAVKAKVVDWPRWIYYGALEGTKGWETVLEVS